MTGKMSDDVATPARVLSTLSGNQYFRLYDADEATVANQNKVMSRSSLLTWVKGTLGAAFGQCRLTKVSTNLVLAPFAGNLLTINSVPATIPDAGVALAPTGLTPATFYYIYATASAGAVDALEASATGPTAQVGTGIQVKTGDSTRTLVGAAYIDTGPAFADTNGKLWVLSYFNRRRKASRTAFTTDRTSTSNTIGEVNTEIRNQFISWADEIVDVSMGAQPRASAAPNQIVSAISIDSPSAQWDDDCLSYASASGVFFPAFQRSAKSGLTEAANHYATVLGRAVAGGFTATWDGRTTIKVMING